MINFLTSNPLSSNSLYIDLPGFMPTFGILVSWTVKTQFSLGKLVCISDLNGIAPMTYMLMINVTRLVHVTFIQSTIQSIEIGPIICNLYWQDKENA